MREMTTEKSHDDKYAWLPSLFSILFCYITTMSRYFYQKKEVFQVSVNGDPSMDN